MRAIIIQDSDAKALLDQLELKKYTGRQTLKVMNLDVEKGDGPGRYVQLDERELDFAMSEIHRTFHYVVTRWLQEQGAKVT